MYGLFNVQILNQCIWLLLIGNYFLDTIENDQYY